MMTRYDSSGRHVVSMRVPLHDVDLGMAVYHGNYYHLFQVARDEFLRDMGFPYTRVMELGFHLTIVEAHCEYRRSLHYDDLIEIATWPQWIRTRSFGVEQRITRGDPSGNPFVCTQLSLSFVCVTLQGKVTRLPRELADLLGRQVPPLEAQ